MMLRLFLTLFVLFAYLKITWKIVFQMSGQVNTFGRLAMPKGAWKAILEDKI